MEFVIPPPNLNKLEITDSRYLHANSCDPYVLYNPYNWSSRLGRSGINEWLTINKLTHLKELHLRGCVDFTAGGYVKCNSMYKMALNFYALNFILF